MDHLNRTPLLLEFSRASSQRKRPGGAVKSDRRRIRARTRAGMPSQPDPLEQAHRRRLGKIRFNQKRDIQPSKSKQDAQRTRRLARPTIVHIHKKRKNPQAKTNRLRKRGNPQARAKTEVRESPSKLEQRPSLPKTPQFWSFNRGTLTKGQRA